MVQINEIFLTLLLSCISIVVILGTVAVSKELILRILNK